MTNTLQELVAEALKDGGLREDYDVRLALATAAIDAVREALPSCSECGIKFITATKASGLSDDRPAVDQQSAGSVNQSSRPDQGTVAVSSGAPSDKQFDADLADDLAISSADRGTP